MLCSARRYCSLVALLFLATSGLGCGDTSFNGSAASRSGDEALPDAPEGPKAPPVSEEGQAEAGPYDALYWFWQCESQPSAPPQASTNAELVVEGAGEHPLDATRIQQTPLRVSGKICPPESLPRDIVFAIDTSLSTIFSDPVNGQGSCGRLQAVEAVLNALPASSDTRIGLVTFSANLAATSQTIHATKAQLYQSLTQGGLTIGQVICGAGGGTNYQAGLNGAAAVLRTGRENASKELYFVSDGRPDNGREGIAEATALKTVGIQVNQTLRPVTIATVMLDDDDEVLEQQIASRDANGAPLHAFAANAGQLAGFLRTLTSAEIVSASLKYRPIGSTEAYTIIDLSDQVDTFGFGAPDITLETANAPLGIELIYEYADSNQNRFATSGKLVWTVSE